MPAQFDAETLQTRFGQINERLGKIEAQLTLLSKTAGVPYSQASGEVPSEVVELAHAGKTGEAIKRYRALTNAGLDEAQEVVSKL
jgi:ribosomal protein L7/L12